MIHRAHPTDLPGLAALEAALFAHDPWSPDALGAQLADPDSWTAQIPGPAGPAAYAVLRCAADEAELLRIGVQPGSRRQGLARALLTAGADWAGERGATRLFLEVSHFNNGALAFYQAQGFRVVGRRRGYYGPDEDAIVMERALCTPRG